MGSKLCPTSWVRATKPLLVDKRRLTYFRRSSRSGIPPWWNIKTSRTRLRSWLNYRSQPETSNVFTSWRGEGSLETYARHIVQTSRKLFHVSYTLINKPSHAISREVINIFQPRRREKNDKRVWNGLAKIGLTFRCFAIRKSIWSIFFICYTCHLSFIILS